MPIEREDWIRQAVLHKELVSPIADAFLQRRSVAQKHPVDDFLFTYYRFSPTKLKQWVPSFEETLYVLESDLEIFGNDWFIYQNGVLQSNANRLGTATVAQLTFIETLCQKINERPCRFGCFGLHEWAMVYRQSQEELRHTGYPLRLAPSALARFIESQNLCCTHYDAYRFFTSDAKSRNLLQPTLQSRIHFEQAGCLHANMDLYKWATKLWPWVGSNFIAKTFLLALEGRKIDMRASPYDLQKEGYAPICIETEEGRKEYQILQQQYAAKAAALRQELSAFCLRLKTFSPKS